VREKGTINILDRPVVDAVQTHVRHLLEDDIDVAQVAILDAALVALVSVVPLTTVLKRNDRRRHKQRLEALSQRAGATAPAVQQMFSQMRWTRRAAFSAEPRFTE
jgi:hypothetical protein